MDFVNAAAVPQVLAIGDCSFECRCPADLASAQWLLSSVISPGKALASRVRSLERAGYLGFFGN